MSLPLTSAVQNMLIDLMNNGKGDLDHSAIVQVIEEASAVEVKKPSYEKRMREERIGAGHRGGLVYSVVDLRLQDERVFLSCAQLELTYVDVGCAQYDLARIAASRRSECTSEIGSDRRSHIPGITRTPTVERYLHVRDKTPHCLGLRGVDRLAGQHGGQRVPKVGLRRGRPLAAELDETVIDAAAIDERSLGRRRPPRG